jgi:hypothetical protein
LDLDAYFNEVGRDSRIDLALRQRIPSDRQAYLIRHRPRPRAGWQSCLIRRLCSTSRLFRSIVVHLFFSLIWNRFAGHFIDERVSKTDGPQFHKQHPAIY